MKNKALTLLALTSCGAAPVPSFEDVPSASTIVAVAPEPPIIEEGSGVVEGWWVLVLLVGILLSGLLASSLYQKGITSVN